MAGAETAHRKKNPVKVEIEDFEDCCRVCMCKEMHMKSVFSTELTQTIKELQYSTGILVSKDDGLPALMCDCCLAKLAVAYKFKSTCLQSDEIFRKILEQKVLINSSIKKEVLDDGNDYQHVLMKEEAEEEVQYDDGIFDKGDDIDTNPSARIKPARARQKKTSKTSKDTIDPGKWPKKKVKRLYCEVCDIKFANKDQSLEHKRDVHGCEWICEICGKQFMHRASHYSHMKSHSPPQYKCAHCSYRTWHKADMNKHVRTHTGNKLFVCEYCTASFYNTSNLYGHIQRNHGGTKTHVCPRCELTFFTAHKLRRHLDSHDNIKRHECEVCHAQFTRRCHWKKHLQKQHSIEVPQIRPGRRKVNVVKGDATEEQLCVIEAKKT